MRPAARRGFTTGCCAAGYDPRSLRKLETETEIRARLAEEKLAQAQLAVRVLTEALHGRVAA